jgi:hypothetical protein
MSKFTQLFFLSAILLPGCASFLGKTAHEMRISSTVPGSVASMVLLDSDGKVTKVIDKVTTPGNLKIKLGFGDRFIMVEAPGYRRHLYKIETNVQAMTYLNILVMPPGLLVDAYSGAFWEPEKSSYEARMDADIVILKNGVRLQGKIVAKDDGYLVTHRNGEIFLQRSMVREIKFSMF